MTHDVSRVPALRADRLGKRYGHTWGLRDCTFEVPPGAIVGLVGPNGAGKTTLLALTVGLLAPTEGQVELFGERSRAQDAATLARVSYLAQDHPLYHGFTVADMFRFGRSLNPSWDSGLAEARMAALDIPLGRKVKSLSGGQQAQVALTIALAKRAPLLLLDEPVASLDPLARLDFMRDVVAAAGRAGAGGCAGNGGGVMIWVTWRQHRTQALTAVAALVLIAVYVLVLGLWARSTFNSDAIGNCLARSGGAGCGGTISSFLHDVQDGAGVPLNLVLLVVPGLLGATVGAPLLGQELERGTWQLAWSQTVPRTRWLVAKLGLIVAGLVVYGAAVTAVWLLNRRTT